MRFKEVKCLACLLSVYMCACMYKHTNERKEKKEFSFSMPHVLLSTLPCINLLVLIKIF